MKVLFTKYKIQYLFLAVLLYAISIYTQTVYDKKYTPELVKNSLEKTISDYIIEFDNLVKNDVLLNSISTKKQISDSFLNKNFGWCFIDENTETPLAWNDKFSINHLQFSRDTLIKDSTGFFYVKYKKCSRKNAFVASYLIKNINGINENKFTGFKSLEDFYDISDSKNFDVSIELNSNNILKLEHITTNYEREYSNSTIFFRIVAVLILVFFVNYHTKIYARKTKFRNGFLLLFTFIISFRALTYFFNFPFWFQKLPLFNPSIYATNSFHRSLGDLLVNTLLLFWLISILETRKTIKNYEFKTKNKFVISLPLIGISLTSLLFINVIESLILDSKIPFDVSNFFGLNVYTIIAFSIICLLVANYHKIIVLLFNLTNKSNIPFLIKLLIIHLTVIITFYFSKTNSVYGNLFCFLVVAWILLYTYFVYLIEEKKVFKNFSSDFSSLLYVLFFTTSTASLCVFFERELDIQQRKNLAENIYLEYNNEEHFTLTHFTAHKLPYAVYNNGNLIYQSGDFIFSKRVVVPKNEFEIHESLNESELLYTPDKKVTIVIYQKDNLVLNFITLFAYLFFTSLLVNSILFLLIKIGNYGKIDFKLKYLVISGIRLQIKATVIGLSVFIFIALAITSIVFFRKNFNDTNDKKLSSIINEIENLVQKNIDSTLSIKINQIVTDDNVDVLLYDKQGKVNKEYFANGNNQHYSKLINYNIFNLLSLEKEDFIKYKSKQSKIQKSFFYKSLYDSKHQMLGLICVVDTKYEEILNKDLSNFIALLININAFIFLLAGAIAFFITIRITSSFTLIKNKMKAINWKSSNEKILWNKNDEIGALVAEYNILIDKLEANAKTFAQSQKEIAWKEMAKQVAHEIKNPLTPMKLSIQYLQSKITEDAPNVKQLTQTVTATLVEQINQLSNIASDFSQFANINNLHLEQFDINEVIRNVINLHSTNEQIIINEKLLEQTILVNADKTQMQRLFTNLFKNAIEASIDNKEIYISIYQTISNNKVITAIQDNGTGILPELQAKIFSVNFTTKSSGTGLGLAICKAIVDALNGSIWFNTSSSGTTFYIEIPITESEN